MKRNKGFTLIELRITSYNVCYTKLLRLRAGSETFVFGNFNIKSKGEYKTLTEVEIIDSFYDLRLDIEALSCARNNFV